MKQFFRLNELSPAELCTSALLSKLDFAMIPFIGGSNDYILQQVGTKASISMKTNSIVYLLKHGL